MNAKYCSLALALTSVFSTIAIAAVKDVLPGLSQLMNGGQFSGSLMFQVWDDSERDTNSESASTVYQLRLSDLQLLTVTKAPKGLFIGGTEQGTFAVVYWKGNWFTSGSESGYDTNVLFYSQKHNTTIRTSFPKSAVEIKLVGQNMFVEFRNRNGNRLIDIDGSNGIIRTPTVNRECDVENSYYHWLFDSVATSNSVLISYRYDGVTSNNSKMCKTGIYVYDVSDGTMHWKSKRESDNTITHTSVASDGRFIWFDGRNGPDFGRKLISATFNQKGGVVENLTAGGDKVVLDSLTKRAGGLNDYILMQMSPDRKYALVKKIESSNGKNGLPAGLLKYYAVDVTRNITIPLLIDNVQHVSGGFVSEVKWVE